MDIEEIRELKDKYEESMRRALCSIFQEFIDVADCYPSFISIGLQEITCMGDKTRKFTISDVKMDIRI